MICLFNSLFLYLPKLNNYTMSVGSDTLSGAASGAALGSVAGPWGTAIGGVVGAGVGLISGVSKKKKRDKAAAAASKRPEYTIPLEVYQNKAMYEALAKSSRVPGQDNIEKKIGQTEAQALNMSQKAAGSSADALAAVGNIQQNSLNNYGDLAQMGAENRRANQDRLAQSRETVADYKQQEFDYNKNQPWQTAFAQNKKLQDENRLDNQNIVNDVQALGSAVGGSMQTDKYGKKVRRKSQTSSGRIYNDIGSGPQKTATGDYSS